MISCLFDGFWFSIYEKKDECVWFCGLPATPFNEYCNGVHVVAFLESSRVAAWDYSFVLKNWTIV